MLPADSTHPKLVRRRLRFSLRTLFIVFTLAAILMGWLGAKLQHERVRWSEEVAAISKIKAVGGIVEISPINGHWVKRLVIPDSMFTVRIVYLRGNSGVDAVLPALHSLPNLQRLLLGDSDVSDEGLRHLRNHPSLTGIELRGTSITDTVVEHLRSIQQLQSVNLDSTCISLEAFAKLKRALPSTYISISGRDRSIPLPNTEES